MYTFYFSGNTDQMTGWRCKQYQCACRTQKHTLWYSQQLQHPSRIFLARNPSSLPFVYGHSKMYLCVCITLMALGTPFHGTNSYFSLWARHVYETLSYVLAMLSKKKNHPVWYFLPNSKHCCFLAMTVIITYRRALKSQKVLSDTQGFSCCVPVLHVITNADCNPPQQPGIIYLVVWYTRHDSGWSTIIKERLKQLYIMLKHSLFPPQTDGPGLQAALDRLNHDSHHI